MKLAIALLLAIVAATNAQQTGNAVVDDCTSEMDEEEECLNALHQSNATSARDCVTCWGANVGNGLAGETCTAIATCTQCEVCAAEYVASLSCIGAGFGNPHFTCESGVPVFETDGDAGGDEIGRAHV